LEWAHIYTDEEEDGLVGAAGLKKRQIYQGIRKEL
jgi:hypothetical protein